jgi:hypothetical protein
MGYYWIIIIIIVILIVIIPPLILKLLNVTDVGVQQITSIGQLVLAILSVVIPMLLSFYKNKKKPVLEFGKFTKTDSKLEPIFFIRINHSDGEGKAKNCIGKIKIGNSNSYSQTVWADQSITFEILQELNGDLRLFKIVYIEKPISSINKTLIPKSILIPTLKIENSRKFGLPYTESEQPYEDNKDKEITIHIDSENAKYLKPFTVKIAEIIDKAIIEH